MLSYEPLFTEISSDRQDRWDCLTKFAEFWHGNDCQPLDDMQLLLQTEARLHVTLPVALIEWQTRFGRFINLWCDGAYTLPINKLRIEDGKLIVRTELVFNGMLEARWGVPLDQIGEADPQVLSILGDKVYPCAETISHFAIYCALYDSINSEFTEEMSCDNDYPFPSDGKKMQFPKSFGIIETEMYEGTNWISMVSGTDWYLRSRNVATNSDEFVKHELRTKGLRP